MNQLNKILLQTHNATGHPLRKIAPLALVAMVVGVALFIAYGLAGTAHVQAESGAIPSLTLDSNEPGQLVINWQAPDPAPTDYRLSWANTSLEFLSYKDSNEAQRGNVYPAGGVITLTLNNLTPGDTYKVQMRSRYYNGDGSARQSSGPWTPITTQRVKNHPPAAPTSLTISEVAHDSLILSWDDPQDANITGYRIQRGTDADSLHSIEANTESASTNYTDSTVEPETTYHYAVIALSQDGNGARSITSVTTPAEPKETVQNDPPPAPTGLMAARVGHSVLALTWNDPEDDTITGYRVLRGTEADNLAVINSDTASNATEYEDDTVAPETTYHYAVIALSANGDSPQSGSTSTTTPAAPKSKDPPPQRVGPRAAAAGEPAITAPNAFRVPAVLSVDLSSITDTDGTTGIATTATYKWQRFNAAGTILDTDSIGTSSTYTLTDADANKRLKVVVSFIDDAGNSEGPLTSAAAGILAAATDCNAPTLTGGATFLGSARKMAVGKISFLGHLTIGFLKTSGSGTLDNAAFTTAGSNNYEIVGIANTNNFVVRLNTDLTAADKSTLVLHICDQAYAFGSSSSSNADYQFNTPSQNWSPHAERTIYLSQDTVAPTFTWATVNGTSLVITLSEDLGAAASLDNTDFAVKKNGSTTPLSTTAPVILGNTVTLTLTTAVAATDTNVLVTYTKPTSGTANKLMDRFGNQVATFTDEDAVQHHALVSNIGQANNSGTASTTHDLAQAFITGANDTGYTLTSIDMFLYGASASETPPTVTLHSGSASGTKVADFTGPSTIGPGDVSYTFAPATTVTLNASTEYWVVAEGATSYWNDTYSETEDGGGAPGWTIADLGQSRPAGTGMFEDKFTTSYQLRINGTVNPTPVTLVSNLSQTADENATYSRDHGQAFTTGSNGSGYTVTSVTIVSTDTNDDTIPLQICEVDGSVHPTTVCTDLTPPSSYPQGNLTYTVPTSPALTLDADTTYMLVFKAPPSLTALRVGATTSDSEDSTSLAGWSIRNTYQWYNNSNTWADATNARAIRLIITGKANTNTPAAGTPAVTAPNTFRVPAVLGVDLSGITDTDGTTGIASNATYKWQRFAADGTTLDTDSIGTDATYTLTDADATKTLKVVVSFTDDGGNSEGPLSSAATAAITAAASCAAPTLTGGAVFLGPARKVVVGEFNLGAHAYYGFNKADDAGSIDNASFTTADLNNYEILVAATRSREDWLLVLDAAFPANVQRTLAVHFCDEDIAFNAATPREIDGKYYYTSDTLLQKWSPHAERTIYLSQDTVAPTFASATVSGTTLVITFNEPLGAAGSLANSAFTVKKGPSGSQTTLTLSSTAPVISGSTVTLTLATASTVSATDTNVLVTYTKPTTGTANKLLDAFGNETGTFAADQVVTNLLSGTNTPAAGTPAVTAPNVFRVPAVLGVDLSGITDTDGTTGIATTATYKWQRFAADGTTLDTDSIGTDSTYTLTDADAGKTLKVVVSFTDDGGTSEGPLTSAATRAITAAASCAAPTYVGGATQIWTGKVGVAKNSDFYGYYDHTTLNFGLLDNTRFSISSNDYRVDRVFTQPGPSLALTMSANFTADEQKTLALHICDQAFALSVAGAPSGNTYPFDTTGFPGADLDWSSHAERTIYLSQDTAAPAFASATVNGTSLVITFNEPLGAAGSLANSAFTVKKNGSATALTYGATAPVISGSTVTLTLATASSVTASDTNVLVTYTKPGTGTANKLVDAFGNETGTFAADQVVTNLLSGTNAPPTVENMIPDQSASADTAFSYTFPDTTFADADSDALTYSATKADGTALPTWLSFAATTRTFSGTPTAAETVSVKVTASDGNGGSVSDTFDITVSAADTTPPTLVSVVVDETGQIIQLRFSENVDRTNLPPASAVTVTADGNALTITGITVPPPSEGLDRHRVLVSPAIQQGQAVVVTYTDPTSGNDTNAFQDIAGNDAATFTTGLNSVPAVTNGSTVAATNTAPTVANIIPDQSATVSTAFSYTFPTTTFADADLDTLTYSATKADGTALPMWLTFTAGTRTFSGTPTAAETVSVKVTASDGNGGSVSDTFDITVRTAANTAPTAANATVDTDQDTSYTFTAADFNYSDPDNNPLASVKITTIPAAGKGTLALDGTNIVSAVLPQTVTAAELNTSKLKYNPPANENGTAYTRFEFKVNDGTVDSAGEYTITINVNPIHTAPLVHPANTLVSSINHASSGTYTVRPHGDLAIQLPPPAPQESRYEDGWNLNTIKIRVSGVDAGEQIYGRLHPGKSVQNNPGSSGPATGVGSSSGNPFRSVSVSPDGIATFSNPDPSGFNPKSQYFYFIVSVNSGEIEVGKTATADLDAGTPNDLNLGPTWHRADNSWSADSTATDRIQILITGSVKPVDVISPEPPPVPSRPSAPNDGVSTYRLGSWRSVNLTGADEFGDAIYKVRLQKDTNYRVEFRTANSYASATAIDAGILVTNNLVDLEAVTSGTGSPFIVEVGEDGNPSTTLAKAISWFRYNTSSLEQGIWSNMLYQDFRTPDILEAGGNADCDAESEAKLVQETDCVYQFDYPTDYYLNIGTGIGVPTGEYGTMQFRISRTTDQTLGGMSRMSEDSEASFSIPARIEDPVSENGSAVDNKLSADGEIHFAGDVDWYIPEHSATACSFSVAGRDLDGDSGTNDSASGLRMRAYDRNFGERAAPSNRGSFRSSLSGVLPSAGEKLLEVTGTRAGGYRIIVTCEDLPAEGPTTDRLGNLIPHIQIGNSKRYFDDHPPYYEDLSEEVEPVDKYGHDVIDLTARTSGSVTATISYPGDGDDFRLTVTPGRRYSITLSSVAASLSTPGHPDGSTVRLQRLDLSRRSTQPYAVSCKREYRNEGTESDPMLVFLGHVPSSKGKHVKEFDNDANVQNIKADLDERETCLFIRVGLLYQDVIGGYRITVRDEGVPPHPARADAHSPLMYDAEDLHLLRGDSPGMHVFITGETYTDGDGNSYPPSSSFGSIPATGRMDSYDDTDLFRRRVSPGLYEVFIQSEAVRSRSYDEDKSNDEARLNSTRDRAHNNTLRAAFSVLEGSQGADAGSAVDLTPGDDSSFDSLANPGTAICTTVRQESYVDENTSERKTRPTYECKATTIATFEAEYSDYYYVTVFRQYDQPNLGTYRVNMRAVQAPSLSRLANASDATSRVVKARATVRNPRKTPVHAQYRKQGETAWIDLPGRKTSESFNDILQQSLGVEFTIPSTDSGVVYNVRASLTEDFSSGVRTLNIRTAPDP